MSADNLYAIALRRSHPMWVIPVANVLQMKQLRPHEELKAEGLLVEWNEHMAPVMFCSHTWLRWRHPDSANDVKFELLCDILRKAIAGQHRGINPHWTSSIAFGEKGVKSLRLHTADLQRDMRDGFVFFDYCSIPQTDPEAQARAIDSLPSYVASSSYFVVLAGAWVHEDDGSVRDEVGWRSRGW